MFWLALKCFDFFKKNSDLIDGMYYKRIHLCRLLNSFHNALSTDV